MASRRRAQTIADGLVGVDHAVYDAIASTSAPALDASMRRLSNAANHSKISLSIAGLLALGGNASRRAARSGVAAIAMASACANLLGKALARRPRPDRGAAGVPRARQVPMPTSASFPSGHAASAFAFATAVSCRLPAAAAPLGLLAAAVSYSRVHTGVHYPADVVAGAVLGVASASVVVLIERRLDTAARSRRLAMGTPGSLCACSWTPAESRVHRAP